MSLSCSRAAAAALLSLPLLALAQAEPITPPEVLTEVAEAAPQVASEDEVQTITVSGKRSALTADLPQTSVGVTASELRERVFVNTEDSILHAPSLTMRKRYIGDRNALIGGRSHNVLQAPRGVVYADGVLLSNFLGRFNAPRWNMVAPEEISRVDVLYGPYSALYPGNSIGTTVLITTRDPVESTLTGRAQYFTQDYAEYGLDQNYGGSQLSAFAGNAWGNWNGSVGVNQLRSESHPMQYATGTLRSTPTPAQQAAAVDVTGAILDRDPRGLDRLILGPDGGALEDDVQNQIKGKLAWQTQALRAEAQLAFWRNDYEREGISFLRDASGNPVTLGVIRSNGRIYTIAESAFGPREGIEEHLMSSLSLRTRRETGWNFSSVASLYDLGTDELRANVPTTGANGNAQAGTITDGASGKGWWNLDLQATRGGDADAHTLTLGYYRSRYELDQERYSTSSWRRGGREALVEDTEGATLIQALYAQDRWAFAPEWSATFGLRAERWEAFDGLRANAINPGGLRYDEREEEDFSPKFSLAYAPGVHTLRYSAGRGVRYPTVSELFQGSIGTTTVNGQAVATIVNNDPNLKAEDSFSQEIAWETNWVERHRTRVSLFRDVIDDTIFQQTNTSVTPSITNIQNVDEVVAQGIELVYEVSALLPNVDVEANLSWIDAKVTRNRNNPQSEGKDFPRIPEIKANLVANWRFAPGWNWNVSALRTGKNFAELDNSDDGGCRFFGCASAFTVANTRLGFRPSERTELGLGLANLTDETYYEFHPYPQRTLLLEARGTF